MTDPLPTESPLARPLGITVWRCKHCPATGRERLENLAGRALNLHVECAHPLQARGLRAAHIYLDRKAA